MRVGIINNERVVSIEETQKAGYAGYHILRFINPMDKFRMPEDIKKAPFGYDAFNVFLPVEIIEAAVSKQFPGIIFIDKNGGSE